MVSRRLERDQATACSVEYGRLRKDLLGGPVDEDAALRHGERRATDRLPDSNVGRNRQRLARQSEATGSKRCARSAPSRTNMSRSDGPYAAWLAFGRTSRVSLVSSDPSRTLR